MIKYYVVTKADSSITSHGMAKILPTGGIEVSKSEYGKIKIGNSYLFADGKIVERLKQPIDMISARKRAEFTIDSAAEGARRRFISQRFGESIEQMLTIKEMEFYREYGSMGSEEADADAYPFLYAEASVAKLTIPAVLMLIDERTVDYVRSMAKIKYLRLHAKMQVALANTETDITNIVSSIEWPHPKSA